MFEESLSSSYGTPYEPDEPSSEEPRWYLVHTPSGREDSVLRSLENRIETMDMKEKILKVILPTEEEIEYKSGERRKVVRKLYPGYLMVYMIMDDKSWYAVRNTPGITGFISAEDPFEKRPRPVPLEDDEVQRIMDRINAGEPRIRIGYSKGESVRIKGGPFADFIGTVSEVDENRGKVRVQVSFFGRGTPVDLDFLQIERV